MNMAWLRLTRLIIGEGGPGSNVLPEFNWGKLAGVALGRKWTAMLVSVLKLRIRLSSSESGWILRVSGRPEFVPCVRTEFARSRAGGVAWSSLRSLLTVLPCWPIFAILSLDGEIWLAYSSVRGFCRNCGPDQRGSLGRPEIFDCGKRSFALVDCPSGRG